MTYKRSMTSENAHISLSNMGMNKDRPVFKFAGDTGDDPLYVDIYDARELAEWILEKCNEMRSRSQVQKVVYCYENGISRHYVEEKTSIADIINYGFMFRTEKSGKLVSVWANARCDVLECVWSDSWVNG